MRCIVIAMLVAAGCASPAGVTSLRFRNQEVVTKVNDRRDVSRRPASRATPAAIETSEGLIFRRVTRALEVPAPRRALDINALGEVPDSTWFENRIGTTDLSPADITRGPNRGPGPRLPLTIVESKLAGKALGFQVRDARGERYIIKFEESHVPLYEVSTDIVVQRLLWAAGYHVPENHVSMVRRDQLLVADDAVIRDLYGNSEPLSQVEVDSELEDAHRLADGRYRILASKHVPGHNLGGWPQEGVREDDPNDTIPHQHRRSLRGLYVFSSWLQSTDLKEGNTVDAWVQDSDRPRRHFVMHYLVDFGKSFGVFVDASRRPADGHARSFDLAWMLAALPRFGLWRRPWEGTFRPGLPGVSTFDARHYDPGKFKLQIPYAPYLAKDDLDMFWASKILLRFSRAHIRAAVAAGFSDSGSISYLTDTLVARRDKTGGYWLRRVNAVDRFRVHRNQSELMLCFDDLVLTNELDARPTRHRLRAFDYAARATGFDRQIAGAVTGHNCVAGLIPGTARAGYTIIRVDTWRGAHDYAPVEVHLARHPVTGAYQVVGVLRR